MFTKQNYLSNTELLKFLRLNRAFNTKKEKGLDIGICSGGTLDELELIITENILVCQDLYGRDVFGNKTLDFMKPVFITSSDWLSEEDVKKGMNLAIYSKAEVLRLAEKIWETPKGIDENLKGEK